MKGRLVFIDSDAVVQGDIEELSRISMRTGDAVAFSDDCSTVSNRVGLHQVSTVVLWTGLEIACAALIKLLIPPRSVRKLCNIDWVQLPSE